MKISYNIDQTAIPAKRLGAEVKSKVILAIKQFIDSGNANMCIECDSVHEASNESINARGWLKRNLKKAFVTRRKNIIYVFKN